MKLHFIIFASLAAAVATQGCVQKKSAADGNPANVTIATTPQASTPLMRLEAVPGMPLLLTLGQASKQSGKNEVSARLADGRALGTNVYNITKQNNGGLEAPAGFRAWMGSDDLGKEWVTSASLTPDSFRIAKIDIPRDAVGPSLWIDDQPIAVQWLLDPESLVPATPQVWPAFLPADAASDTGLMQVLRQIAKSPQERWRVRLLIDGLITLRPDVERIGVYSDPLAEALAQQVEQRWRLAFARLSQVDSAMAHRVKQRLCLVAALPGAGKELTWVPAWPTDMASIDRLRGDLADPKLSRGDLSAKAHQWLREQPQGAAWIVDDGGELAKAAGDQSAKSRPVVFVGVTNLSDRSETAAAARAGVVERDAASSDTGQIEALVSGKSRMIFIAPSTESKEQTTDISVTLGRWRGTLVAAAAALPAIPPSFVTTPLSQDLTLTSWQYGASLNEPIPSVSGVSVSLIRNITLEGAPGAAWSARISWPSAQTGQVELHFGSASAPIAVVAVAPSGETSRLDVSDLAGPSQSGKVQQGPQGQNVVIYDLPQSYIEQGDILRLGISHTTQVGNGRLVRSCWPRPRLPWQSGPGRAAIDLGSWSGLPQR